MPIYVKLTGMWFSVGDSDFLSAVRAIRNDVDIAMNNTELKPTRIRHWNIYSVVGVACNAGNALHHQRLRHGRTLKQHTDVSARRVYRHSVLWTRDAGTPLRIEWASVCIFGENGMRVCGVWPTDVQMSSNVIVECNTKCKTIIHVNGSVRISLVYLFFFPFFGLLFSISRSISLQWIWRFCLRWMRSVSCRRHTDHRESKKSTQMDWHGQIECYSTIVQIVKARAAFNIWNGFWTIPSSVVSHCLTFTLQMFANISTDVCTTYMARAAFSGLCLLMVELTPARMLTQHQSFNKFSFMGG